MILEAVQFFQPVMILTDDGKRPALVTSGRMDEYSMVLENNVIKMIKKGNKRVTYVTLNNTCWFAPVETENEPITSQSPSQGTKETSIKRRPVAKHKLSATDSVHSGPSEA